MNFKHTSLALAVAAFVASPLAFASEGDLVPIDPPGWKDDGHTDVSLSAKLDLELNVDVDLSTSRNNIDINIDKDVVLDEYVDVDIDVNLYPNSYSRAMIDDKQRNNNNVGLNHLLDNDAGASGKVLQNASGNIGLNIVAGDNNQQDNAAALAAADSGFVFGMADAQAHSWQDGEFNFTLNDGVANNAGMSGRVLQNARGNIGVNIAAGNNNQQKNNLAAAVSGGMVSTAMVTVKQESNRNKTINQGRVDIYTDRTFVTMSGSLDGRYSGEASGHTRGISDQVGDLYVDNWQGPSHPGGPHHGHSDFDNQAQGSVDRPVYAEGVWSNGGAFSFNERGSYAGREAGNQWLAGTFSGYVTTTRVILSPATNTASLSGKVLRNARGNIGVNIAAGTGNQQNNSLAISAIRSNGGGGTPPGEPH